MALFNSRRSVGLEIRNNEIRFLQVDKGKVVHFVKFHRKENDKKEWISKIREWTNHNNLPGALSLPQDQILITTIKIATTFSKKEIEWEIKENLHRYFSTTQKLHFDFKIVGKNAEAFTIMVIAGFSEEIERWIDITNQANLRIKIIDSPRFAMLHALRKLYPQNQKLCLIHIAETNTQLILINRKELLLNQTFLHQPFFPNKQITEVLKKMEVNQYSLFLINEENLNTEELVREFSHNITIAPQNDILVSYGLALRASGHV